jgi:hypothetical protein
MSFYFRKSLSLGRLLRLNLSRSGLGVSAGVPGARIGVGPRGSYVHVGRGGLYYRQSLPGGTRGRARVVVEPGPLPEVESERTESLQDASSEDLLRELTRVQRRTPLLPFVLVPLIAAVVALMIFATNFQEPPSALLVALASPQEAHATSEVLRERFIAKELAPHKRASQVVNFKEWMVYPALGLLLPLGFLLSIWARHRDVTHGTAMLKYDLEGEAEVWFKNLVAAFGEFSSCDRVWHVSAQGATSDWKRNAGASTLVQRRAVLPTTALPRRVQSNITPLMLPAGRQTLYFFPDRLLVYESNAVGAVSYASLHASPESIRFRESGGVPGDAEVLEYTWRFVAKSGGPDRRFGNNAQIPVLRYSELHLTSDSGLNEMFQCSRPNAADTLARAINSRRLKSAHSEDSR